MTHSHAQFIADRIPGAEARGWPKSRWVSISASGGFQFEIGINSEVHLWSDGVTLDAATIASTLADLRMKFNEINSAIAAATAAGFPEGKQGEVQS